MLDPLAGRKGGSILWLRMSSSSPIESIQEFSVHWTDNRLERPATRGGVTVDGFGLGTKNIIYPSSGPCASNRKSASRSYARISNTEIRSLKFATLELTGMRQ